MLIFKALNTLTKVNPDLTLEDVKSFIKTPKTWRSTLSICNIVDDSFGLASSQIINSKLQGPIKKDTLSVENPGVWDTPVSSKLIKECSAAFKEGAGEDSRWFLLSTLSSLTVKKPQLVGFWDRSSAFSLAKTVSSMMRIKRLSQTSNVQGIQ